MHVIWSYNVRLLFVEHDDLVILLPRCGEIIEMDSDVTVRSGFHVHGENQGIAVVQEVVHLLIPRQGGDHRIVWRDPKILTRLKINQREKSPRNDVNI